MWHFGNLAIWHFKIKLNLNGKWLGGIFFFRDFQNMKILLHWNIILELSLFAFIVLFQNWVHHDKKTKGLLNIIDVEMKAGSLTDPLLNLWGSFVVPYGLTRLSAVTQFVKVTINALTPFAVTNRPGSKLRRFSLHKQLPRQINFSTFSHFYVFKIFLYDFHTHKYRD